MRMVKRVIIIGMYLLGACFISGEVCPDPDALALTPKIEATIPSLSQAEKEWIADHPVIISSPDPDFPPAEYFDSQGIYRGLVADYLALIAERVGLKFDIRRLSSWDAVLDHARSRRIDLVTAASQTPQRDEYLLFTDPFIQLPAVIIVRQQVDRTLTMEKLKGLNVAVVRNYAAHDYIANSYPDLKLDPVDNIQTGLRKVSFGMVDAMVANIATVSYYIEKGTITNLKVAGESGFTYRLSFAPRKDWPVLKSILNKGLASLSPGERRKIEHKWIRLEHSRGLSREGWIALIAGLGVVGLLVGGVLVWNRSLRTQVEKKTRDLTTEIGEHEAAKQTLLESESRYRGIVEYTKNGVLVFRAVDEGRDFVCVNFNKSVLRIDQLEALDLLDNSIQEIFPAIESFGLLDVIRTVWRTGEPSYFPAKWYKDHRISGWRDFFVYKLPTQEVVAVYNDETVRKRAERALRESEEKLAGIVDSVTDYMVMLDQDLNIVWANNLAQRVLGPDLDQRRCYEVFAGRNQPCENCIAQGCFIDGRKHEHEIKVEKGSGRRSDYWEITNPAALDRRRLPKTVIAVFRDITERKALAAEAMRASHLASIGELAAGVAHEINNPINSVINLAQLVYNENNGKSDFQTDVARRMIKEGRRIAGIVQSLLAFARDRKESKQTVFIADILDETLSLTAAQIEKDGIVLHVSVSADLPPITAQMQQIQQIGLNLINNARYALNQKFNGLPGEKRIEIEADLKIREGRRFVRVIFEDNGPGIPEKDLDRVLDPFFTTKPRGEGTGLGLSISHGIVGDHHGHLKIDSREGEFTRVILDLPADSSQ